MADIVVDPLRWESLEAGAAATVVQWLASEGDHVEAGQPLVQALLVGERLEVPAPHPGVLERILVPAGERFGPGDVLGWLVVF